MLILDEPTAVLVPQDVEALFATIRRITAQGLGVLFISHKLREVAAVSDRVSVLRRGRIIDTIDAAGVEPRHLAELMVGRPTIGVRRADAVRPDGRLAVAKAAEVADLDVAGAAAVPVLTIENLTVAGRGRNAVDGVTLQVRPGEIVGIAGVSGNGQRQLVDVLCGIAKPTGGRVRVDGRDVTGAGPHEVIARRSRPHPRGPPRRAAHRPQRRAEPRVRAPRRSSAADRSSTEAAFARTPKRSSTDSTSRHSPGDTVGSLSGGNVQKVLLARVLMREPKVVVVAQPTRGLDVGAAEYVHRQLLDRRAVGAGVLLVSEDLEELLALCDRLVVLFEGRIDRRTRRGGRDARAARPAHDRSGC